MPMCSVKYCSNRPGSKRNVVPEGQTLRFYNFPALISNQGDATKSLCEERRRQWKAAVHRKDITTDQEWEKTIVCSRHFINGVKAYLHVPNNPSWVPTLHLGHSGTIDEKKSYIALERYERHQKRAKRDAATTKTSAKRLKTVTDTNPLTAEHQPPEDVSAMKDYFTFDHDTEEQGVQEAKEVCENNVSSDCEMDMDSNGEKVAVGVCQTDVTGETLSQIFQDLDARVVESASRKTRHSVYERQCYVGDEAKLEYYTGLPKLEVFDLLYDFVEPCLRSASTQSLSNEQQVLLCLIKLRLNYQFQDMAYQLGVSKSTVTRCFHKTLDIIVKRLAFLIRWPSRESLRHSTPMCFRENFGTKVVVIVDCFELTSEKPSGQANLVQTNSNYKHGQTTKFLIGISPTGSVSFISSGFGGRASDKHIIEDSKLLEKLLPGDIIMADRGFTIEDEVQFFQAKLAMPNFTHGKKQLHPMAVENTKKIAQVRIHIERVIGRLLRKFTILQRRVPIEFMNKKPGEECPAIDKIVNACCCIVNLHRSVIPLD